MDVVVICNGLGNQMSQYALYLQKKKINNNTILIFYGKQHNGFELNKVFGIGIVPNYSHKILLYLFKVLKIAVNDKLKLISKLLKPTFGLFNIWLVKEGYDYKFKPQYLLPSKGLKFYFGGWHSEHYFSSIKDQLLSVFEFKQPQDAQNLKYINDINNANSIAVHIRRGDYLDAANINIFGDVCSVTYYKKAIQLMNGKIESPHYFVFSNDIEWVKDNLDFNMVTFVESNTGINSWKDMYLMSVCKHNIVANSTFSWWGAWLNKNEEKIVISPDRFLKTDTEGGIYPDSWIRLSSN